MTIHHHEFGRSKLYLAFVSPCSITLAHSCPLTSLVAPSKLHTAHYQLPYKGRRHRARSHGTICAMREQPQHRGIYFATCARGLGQLLASELQADPINAQVLKVAASGVRFQAVERGHVTGYRACLWLRTAMRVLLEVSRGELDLESTAGNSEQISYAVYDYVKQCADWAYLLQDGSKSFSIQVRVSGALSNACKQQGANVGQRRRRYERRREGEIWPPSTYLGEHTVQVVAKDAICDALRDKGVEKPSKPRSHSEADVPLFITLHGGSICVYLDMAGASLHKRGYRSDNALHKSSLNESVAAGMLYLAGFRPDGSFTRNENRDEGNGAETEPLVIVDPMCGSGTLLIEAALLRLRVAVGLYRRRFAFEGWRDFDETVLREVVEEAVRMQRTDADIEATFIGNDVDPRALRIARKNLEQTRLSEVVSLHQGDARDFSLPRAPTLTISNPPWGLRLEGEIEAWEKMGCFLREFGRGCEAVFLSGDSEVTRGLRMRARRKVAVRIGNVDTRVVIYDVLPKK